MTIAYSSVYIQTLHFTFGQQAVIVYSDAERWILM